MAGSAIPQAIDPRDSAVVQATGNPLRPSRGLGLRVSVGGRDLLG